MSAQKVSYELTPNPATMKFLLYQEVTTEPFECTNVEEAERSPLAMKIFGFPWTHAVYIGPDFISVTKQDWVEWNVLAGPLANLIQEHRDRNEGFLVELDQKSTNETSELDLPVVKKIKDIINREIRPVVALDGGDIVFNRYEDGIVYIHMRGACSGCPSSTATLKDGIEVRIKELLPDVIEVVAI